MLVAGSDPLSCPGYSLYLSHSKYDCFIITAVRLPADERNLLYVAASRAKCQLCLSPTCISVLQSAQVN